MRVFISSIISGLQTERSEALTAARTLGHEVKMAEDFAASSQSPQQACLAGVRWAQVVVLILGARYGERQQSGLSATHEEYREAKDRSAVLAFIQRGVEREPSQDTFVREVQDWVTGIYTAEFAGGEQLRTAVVRALHDLEISQQSGPTDEPEMLARAERLCQIEDGNSRPSLSTVVVAGPRQAVIRPAELEREDLRRSLLREAMFGAAPLFRSDIGSQSRIEEDALVVEQERGGSILLSQLGDLRVVQLLDSERQLGLSTIIEEDVRECLDSSIRFASWAIDQVDPVRRVTDVAIVVGLNRAYLGWRTRAEHNARPNSVEMAMGTPWIFARLSPGTRRRGSLAHDRAAIVEDLVTLLRRGAKAR